MSIKNRVERLEQDNQPNGLVVIAIEENETNEQSYQRCFPDGSIKPKQVIYATPLDVML